MAQYKLYCCGGSGNSYKVALYLNCAGLDWEPIGVDFAGGETRDVNWRADTNAMGEVPVVEVAGKRMSQSGAILMCLQKPWVNSPRPVMIASRLCAGFSSTITNLRTITQCIEFKIVSLRVLPILLFWRC